MPVSAVTSRWKVLLCGAFALAVWGAKLWIIAKFGNATPVSDEWDAHAVNLFAPYMDSTLSLGQLLAPHNEHRTYVTRAIALALFAANGTWDPILEMIVNAVLHTALGVCILVLLGRQLGRLAFGALAIVVAVLVAVPNASENPVWGMETHFYTVLLFGLVAIHLLSRESGSLLRCGLGLLAATLAFFSLASGALVFLACAALVAARRWLGVEPGWRPWGLVVALLACFALAVALTPTIEAHGVYRAHSIAEFIHAFEVVTAWPFRVHRTVATALVNAPLAILAWRTLRKPPPGTDVAWVLLGLGLWNALQFAALAFGRSIGIDSTRYIDICALNLVVNFASAAIVAERGRARLLAGVWLAVVATGWAVDTAQHVPRELEARRSLGLVQEANVRAFLTTGAFLPGASGADLSVPYPDAARLANILSDPRVRQVLPSVFQDAVAGAPSSLSRGRLGGVRDGLLAAGPSLAIGGALLMLLLLILRPPLDRKEPSSRAG